MVFLGTDSWEGDCVSSFPTGLLLPVQGLVLLLLANSGLRAVLRPSVSRATDTGGALG